VLDLYARVHFHEVKLAAFVKQKLHRARVGIIARFCAFYGCRTHSRAQFLGHDGAGRLLN
jgi:hypothetical protein